MCVKWRVPLFALQQMDLSAVLCIYCGHSGQIADSGAAVYTPSPMGDTTPVLTFQQFLLKAELDKKILHAYLGQVKCHLGLVNLAAHLLDETSESNINVEPTSGKI